MTDPDRQLERCRATYDAFRQILLMWKPLDRPFQRLPFDGAQLLAGLAVGRDGRLRGPSSQKFWEVAFESLDLPTDPAGELKRLNDSPQADPALLLGRVLVPDISGRRDRLETLLFAQRVFEAAPDRAAPDVLVAVRGFVRFRALMLTLERMGVAEPAQYARAAFYASRLNRPGNPKVAAVSLSAFQATLALIERTRFNRLIDWSTAGTLVDSLLRVAPTETGYYGGHSPGGWRRRCCLRSRLPPAARLRSRAGSALSCCRWPELRATAPGDRAADRPVGRPRLSAGFGGTGTLAHRAGA